jgi:formiminotetrahydrofolate cyclodeaminase
MLDICQKVLEIIETLSSKIKKNFISDLNVSLNFLETALLSANIFVSLNLKYVEDRTPLEPYLKIDIGQIQKRLEKLKGALRWEK